MKIEYMKRIMHINVFNYFLHLIPLKWPGFWSVGRLKKRAGNEQGLGEIERETPDPARHPPFSSIVPT